MINAELFGCLYESGHQLSVFPTFFFLLLFFQLVVKAKNKDWGALPGNTDSLVSPVQVKPTLSGLNIVYTHHKVGH